MSKKYFASVSFFDGLSVCNTFNTKKTAFLFIEAVKRKSKSLASIEMIVDVTDADSSKHKTIHFVGGV